MHWRNAVVTGASRGVGRAVAQTLAARGLEVVLSARDVAALDAATAAIGGRASAIAADLREPARIVELVREAESRLGGIDVFVANAGLGAFQPFLETTPEEIADTVAVNLTAVMLCARAVLPGMVERERGLFVVVASDLSRRYLAQMAPYAGTKWGVLGFAGSLLREFKGRGIRVCTVMPGMIDTAFGGRHPEGSRPAEGALRAQQVADAIASLLDQPDHVVVDEIVLHPLGQDF